MIWELIEIYSIWIITRRWVLLTIMTLWHYMDRWMVQVPEQLFQKISKLVNDRLRTSFNNKIKILKTVDLWGPLEQPNTEIKTWLLTVLTPALVSISLITHLHIQIMTQTNQEPSETLQLPIQRLLQIWDLNWEKKEQRIFQQIKSLFPVISLKMNGTR